MTKLVTLPVLFSESEIRSRVADVAGAIFQLRDPPDLAMPVLVGGFIFAADLLRALDSRGLGLPVEFVQLRSYGESRSPESESRILVGPPETVRGRHVLLIDGVLDSGRTLAKARQLVLEAEARAVTTVVAIDKRRLSAVLMADFAAFTDVDRFVAGYGMDDGGRLRSLPYIIAVELTKFSPLMDRPVSDLKPAPDGGGATRQERRNPQQRRGRSTGRVS